MGKGKPSPETKYFTLPGSVNTLTFTYPSSRVSSRKRFGREWADTASLTAPRQVSHSQLLSQQLRRKGANLFSPQSRGLTAESLQIPSPSPPNPKYARE